MQIDHEQLDRRILKINLAGRMDLAGSEEIHEKFAALTAAPRNAVIVDLSQVDFVSSVGIRTLLLNAKALKSRGGRMVLLNPDAKVTQVLAVAGLDRIIGVFRDLETACAALARDPPADDA
jgi:anti-sigma B factor antagonist